MKKSNEQFDRLGDYERSVTLTINSKQSIKLVLGRKADPQAKESWQRSELIGLMKFKNTAYKLWYASKGDNPYVDQWLLELEEKIESTFEYLAKNINHIQLKISKMPDNLSVEQSRSTKPLDFKYDLGPCSYANQGIQLIALFDQLMSSMDTAKSNGMLPRKEFDAVKFQCEKRIKAIFVYPGLKFNYLNEGYNLTREDYLNGTGKAVEIIKELGKLDTKIIDKELLPEYGFNQEVMDDAQMDLMADIFESTIDSQT